MLLNAAPGVVDGGPVEQVEDEEQEGEEDEEGEVRHGVGVLLPPEAAQLPQLHLEQDAGVLHQRREHEHDAADHPRLHRREALRLKIFSSKRNNIFHRSEEAQARSTFRYLNIHGTAISLKADA